MSADECVTGARLGGPDAGGRNALRRLPQQGATDEGGARVVVEISAGTPSYRPGCGATRCASCVTGPISRRPIWRRCPPPDEAGGPS